MSHYRPPPVFGAPFNPNGQFGPSSNTTYPSLANFSYYQSSDPTHPGHVHQPASFASAYPFNATSQSMNITASRPGMSQIPYSGFGQTTSGSLLSPSYPSIQPHPFTSFPTPHPPPPPFFQRENHPAPTQAHTGLPSKPPPAVSSISQGVINDTSILAAINTELEDGELSDGERGRELRGPLGPMTSNGVGPPDDQRQATFDTAKNHGIKKNNGAHQSFKFTSQEGI